MPAATAVVVVALCLNAADALRSAPDYLAYFNIFVKPENAWRLLTDSNLDWGQGLIALRAYQQQHPQEPLYLAYFGRSLPGCTAFEQLLSPQRTGQRLIVAGASCLTGQVLDQVGSYPGCSFIDRSACWIALCGCSTRRRNEKDGRSQKG
jgi:hypothetical protein